MHACPRAHAVTFKYPSVELGGRVFCIDRISSPSQLGNRGPRSSRTACMCAIEICCHAIRWRMTSLTDQPPGREGTTHCSFVLLAMKLSHRSKTSLSLPMRLSFRFISSLLQSLDVIGSGSSSAGGCQKRHASRGVSDIPAALEEPLPRSNTNGHGPSNRAHHLRPAHEPVGLSRYRRNRL